MGFVLKNQIQTCLNVNNKRWKIKVGSWVSFLLYRVGVFKRSVSSCSDNWQVRQQKGKLLLLQLYTIIRLLFY